MCLTHQALAGAVLTLPSTSLVTWDAWSLATLWSYLHGGLHHSRLQHGCISANPFVHARKALPCTCGAAPLFGPQVTCTGKSHSSGQFILFTPEMSLGVAPLAAESGQAQHHANSEGYDTVNTLWKIVVPKSKQGRVPPIESGRRPDLTDSSLSGGTVSKHQSLAPKPAAAAGCPRPGGTCPPTLMLARSVHRRRSHPSYPSPPPMSHSRLCPAPQPNWAAPVGVPFSSAPGAVTPLSPTCYSIEEEGSHLHTTHAP